MKICYFAPYPPAAGRDSFNSYCFARDLGSAGHDVFVISNCWELERKHRVILKEEELPRLEPERVKLFSTLSSERYDHMMPLGLTDRLVDVALKAVDAHDADLLICANFFPFGVAGMYLKFSFNKPLILHNRERSYFRNVENPFFRRLLRETLKRADRIEIQEREWADFQKVGTPAAKISFTEDSVNPDYFSPSSEPFDFSPYTDIDVGTLPVITFLDSPEPFKKLFSLVDLVAGIADRDFILCIQMDRETEMLHGHFRDFIRDRSLDRRIIFLPPQPPWRFPSLMNSSTCIIYPGNADECYLPGRTIPLHYIEEALLCGKCTLIAESLFQRSGLSHLKAGEHTLLFESENSAQLREMLESLIGDPGLADTIGGQARSLALSRNEHGDILREKMMMLADVHEKFRDAMKGYA